MNYTQITTIIPTKLYYIRYNQPSNHKDYIRYGINIILHPKEYKNEFSTYSGAATTKAIDADYDAVLRRRETLFATVTKTQKANYHTFITTYGVAQNNYSGIVQSEVTADDLFS